MIVSAGFNGVAKFNFGELEESYCLKLIRKVRSAGISCDLYPSSAKLKKQMK